MASRARMMTDALRPAREGGSLVCAQKQIEIFGSGGGDRHA
jgi:hypothetical protein